MLFVLKFNTFYNGQNLLILDNSVNSRPNLIFRSKDNKNEPNLFFIKYIEETTESKK